MTTHGLTRPPRMRLADAAHQSLRLAIIEGKLAMGERLTEAHIAEELGMSRAPVREAIQRLAAEGLVSVEPHLGAQVLDLSLEDIVDLHNLRLGLETTALRLFLARGSSAKPLRTHLNEMKAAAAKKDAGRLINAELDWHRSINVGSGNQLIARMFGELEGRILLATSLEDRVLRVITPAGNSHSHLSYVVEEHEQIISAIEEGRNGEAQALFEKHFLSTVALLLQRLGGDPSLLLEPMSGTSTN
ncbi:GntR family transcriptional regulator [Micrococcaceae bacterium Sec5.1]